ncbi:MAG: c-type cytochrome biogenesis protein CcmI, partial [Pseudomonadota bacterium]
GSRAIYAAQLKEIDRDLARGVLDPADAERMRAEVARRLLDHADVTPAVSAPTSTTPLVIGLALTAVIALGTYALIGAPGRGDLPLEARKAALDARADTRPSQAEAEAAFNATRAAPGAEADSRLSQMVAQLRTAMQSRPEDVEGLALLARNEAILGNYQDAVAAQRQLLSVKGDAATLQDRAALADLLILAAGGFVSPEAEAVLTDLRARDPANGTARYYLGLMHSQSGRADLAFRLWAPLLAEYPVGAPWSDPIRDQIEDIAAVAGVNYVPPARGGTFAGPSQADVDAAADLSPEDRLTMIEGMVEGLSERLATDGGTPREWAQLIQSLAVLGRVDQARAILAEGRTVFADSREAL